MPRIAYALERLRRRQRVRYWALALPLVVVMLALPLLRPLRHPDPTTISDDEWVRLESVRRLATEGTLSLDPERLDGRVTVVIRPGGAGRPTSAPTTGRGAAATRAGDGPGTRPERRAGGTGDGGGGGGVYLPAQEPMLSVLGAGVYQVLRLARTHVGPETVLGTYLMTLVLATFPVAVTTTLLYRCGRLLELSRFRRILLSFGCVGCTALLPYATVLSPYGMAAMLATGAFASLAHVAMSRPPPGGLGWVMLAGFLGSLGAAVHPSVATVAVALAFVPLAMPVRRRVRVLCVGMYLLGAVPPVVVHRALLQPYDVGGGTAAVEGGGAVNVMESPSVWGWAVPVPVVDRTPEGRATPRVFDEEQPDGGSGGGGGGGAGIPTPEWVVKLEQVWRCLVGPFGVLSHSPVLVVAVAGVMVTVSRHWPRATRALALASLAGVVGPLLYWSLGPPRGGERMFAAQPLVAASPILLLWAGVFLRGSRGAVRRLYPSLLGWSLAVFSLLVAAVGMAHPYPRGGFKGYPPAEIVTEWVERAGRR